MTDRVLEAVSLSRHYSVRPHPLSKPKVLRALDGVDFTVDRGETIAVVGESGCGKSTLARLVTLIEAPSAGTLLIEGRDVADAVGDARRALRRSVQIVFQDPYGSLNPRKKIRAILEEPLVINTDLSAAARRDAARAMLTKVGLRPEHDERYPHMFSGGQRQRIAIARALMLEPTIVVADEPVSALDVSIQAQVLNLLMDLQDELALTYVFISHDLSVVRHIATTLMVMYLGRAVEQGEVETIFAAPRHPYTRALMSATPHVDPSARRQREPLAGELPSPLDPPSGCAFHTRCPHSDARCAQERPAFREFDGRRVACHHAERV